MGLLWFFEVLAGLVDLHEGFWYLTDVANMGQGIYVFLVFVCKRRVIDVVLGKERARRVSSAFQKVSFKKRGPKTGGGGEESVSKGRTKDTMLGTAASSTASSMAAKDSEGEVILHSTVSQSEGM